MAPASHPRRLLAAVALLLGVVTGSLTSASPAGAGDVSQCTTSSDSQVHFICGTYEGFARRTPSNAEVTYWIGQMPAKKTVFVSTLGHSVESRHRIIEAYYDAYTAGGNDVDQASLDYWTGEVLKPNGLRRLEATLLGSYQGMVDGYLSFTFGAVLGREPSEAESTYWGTRVVQTSRGLVAADLIYTVEARRLAVRFTYRDETTSYPDTASRDYWAERLRTGTSYLDLRIALKSSYFPGSTHECSSLTPPTEQSFCFVI